MPRPAWIDVLALDLRESFRALRHGRGVAVLAVVTLGLAIGASTAIFTVVNGVLLKPLSYSHPDRLVTLIAEQYYEGTRRPLRTQWPSAAVAAWPPTRSIDRIGFYARGAASLAGADTSDLVDVAYVSPQFFATVNGRIALGRALVPADDGNPVVVISAPVWRRAYGGLANALGRSVTLSGHPYTVVGVADDTFQVPDSGTEVWIPAGFVRTRDAACCSFTAIARLHPGVDLVTAGDEVAGIARALAAEMPRALGDVRVRLVRLQDLVVGDTRSALLVLAAAVGLLFAVACANVINLLLARNAARRHETAVRRALGATEGRILQQSVAEAAILTTGGAGLGIALAVLAVGGLKAWPPNGFPRLDAVAIDGSVLMFGCAVAALATAAAGLLPVLRRGDTTPWLRPGGKGVTSSRAGRTALRATTVVQLTISLVLLVGAVLLGRSFAALMRTDLGIIPDRVATASVNLSMNRKLTDQQQIDLVERLVERVGALPDVAAAGVGSARPPDVSRVRLTLNRTDDPTARATFAAAAVPATPGYFAALGIRLERGRLFTAADDESAPQVVIVSADTARQLFGAEDPIGRKIRLPTVRNGKTASEEMTVVGITGNVKYGGIDQPADALVYRPFAQQPWRSVFLVVRTSGDPDRVVAALPHEIAAVDGSITVADVATLDTVLRDVTAQPRFRALLLLSFASIAIVIAAVGLYGVIAYSVSQRRGEIGVRMALGADSRQIKRMVLREGGALALLGTVSGLASAGAVVHLLSGVLYGVAPTDAASFAIAAGGLLVVSLAATYVPAARAARTDPLVVLRMD